MNLDYKEKLRLAKEALDSGSYDKETIEYIFPELKESEDEKIKKTLIKYFRNCVSLEGINGEDISNWLEKQGEQKPADKPKPRFKVGCWVVCCNHEPEQIIGIKNNMYEMSNGDIRPFYMIDNNHNMRLWTIQDAKDGDVLHAHSFASDCVFLYKNTYEVEPYNKVDVAYCCIDVYSNRIEFGIQGPDCIDVRNTKPATKEQRDLLFQKMKEAGYEWDVEKKELKKIEQKTIFCHHEVDLSNCSEEYRKAYYDGWNNCNQQHAQLEAEQKPAWSEKGTKIIEEAASFILACVNIADTKEEEERLEKLADKLQDLRPQLKQEWSEEDEYNLNWIINDYERASQTAISSVWEGRFKMFVDWLKSLKERYAWKPSDEQIKQLGWIAEQNKDNIIGKELMSLYQDLKKLREE